jgi:CelD/BcsL family acetyltransferase involved in cellulose biosynthesis
VATDSTLSAAVSIPLRSVARPRVESLAHCFQPLQDRRWDAFLLEHPKASVFHSSAWLRALQTTYGYDPVAFTTSAPGQRLQNAMVFCRVESWLTGRRLVSLPFSDHCEALVDTQDDISALTLALEQEFAREQWRYIELRPLISLRLTTALRHSSVPYTFHLLDLAPEIDTLFRNFHKNSIQRKIHRAERERLTYSEGASEELLDHFYRLFVITRQRHRLPPPPRRWFSNLVKCAGEALKIRAASHLGKPVAAMITLRYKDTMVYKYGCSDARFNNLGSMPFLFWTAIQEAKADGLRFFDFGRTDAEQEGLITFKRRWGADQAVVNYSRYSSSEQCAHAFDLSAGKWKSRAAKFTLGHLPRQAYSTIGRMLYQHIG